MKLRRDILLFAAVAVAALVGGWWLLSKRPGAAIDAFVDGYAKRVSSIQRQVPAADAFRVTICPGQACAAIEVGGLTFIWGAGAGAADGIAMLGLMHPSLDGVLLPDTNLRSVEGLAAIAQASGRAGRTDGLKVYAPAGSLAAVDGANLLATGSKAPRLQLSPDGADQGLAGKLLFDSGVVEIRAFGATGRVYRIEFDGKSLVLAGCKATADDIFGATQGAQTPAGVLTASSSELLSGGPQECTDITDLVEAVRRSRLGATLVIPAEPSATIDGAAAAWRDILGKEKLEGLTLAEDSAAIELAGTKPRLSGPR